MSQCPCLINSCHSVCCSKRVGMGWFGRCFFFACLGPCFTGKARCGCTGGWAGLCLRKPLLQSKKKVITVNGHEPLSIQLRCFNSLIKQAAGAFSCFSHQHNLNCSFYCAVSCNFTLPILDTLQTKLNC